MQGSWRDQNGLDEYCPVLRDMDWFGRNTEWLNTDVAVEGEDKNNF